METYSGLACTFCFCYPVKAEKTDKYESKMDKKSYRKEE